MFQRNHVNSLCLRQISCKISTDYLCSHCLLFFVQNTTNSGSISRICVKVDTKVECSCNTNRRANNYHLLVKSLTNKSHSNSWLSQTRCLLSGTSEPSHEYFAHRIPSIYLFLAILVCFSSLPVYIIQFVMLTLKLFSPNIPMILSFNISYECSFINFLNLFCPVHLIYTLSVILLFKHLSH